MSERNQRKLRLCHHCGKGIMGKAYALMKHYESHKKQVEEAAEEAIMRKIKEEMEKSVGE